MEQSKLHIHACGGAATSIVDKSLRVLSKLGNGFANVEYHFIDTSRNNYDNIDPLGDFFLIERKTNDKSELRGSGGDRVLAAHDIALNIPDYLDSLNIKSKKTGEYSIVLSSAGGASGSTTALLLTEELLKKNIPVIAIVVGDSSDDLKSRNTQAVLASYSNIAIKNKKCLLMYYINNFQMGGNITSNELEANDRIENCLKTLSLFLSGVNESIDATDMENFISQHNYVSLRIPAGVYTLTIHGGNQKIELPDHALSTVARSLTAGNTDVDFNLNVLHHKYGKIVEQNAIDMFNSALPVHIVASNGLLKEEVRMLNEANEASKKKQADLENYNIEPSSNTIEDDELDMFF